MATNQAVESYYNHDFLMQLRAPANDSDLALDNNYIVEELSNVLYLSPGTLLSHDSPVNSNAIFEFSFQNPINGDVHWDGNLVIFIPNVGYRGPASFQYVVMDRQGRMDAAMVKLKI